MINHKFENFFIDVDGVMTKVFFAYSKFGKKQKFFSADDSEAVKILSKHINIHFVTADFRGYKISRRRIEKDMGQKLSLVPAQSRLEWLSKFDLPENIIYMGDSFLDIDIMKAIGYGVTVNDASVMLKPYCGYITESKGGERAVSEACFHVLEKFFNSSL